MKVLLLCIASLSFFTDPGCLASCSTCGGESRAYSDSPSDVPSMIETESPYGNRNLTPAPTTAAPTEMPTGVPTIAPSCPPTASEASEGPVTPRYGGEPTPGPAPTTSTATSSPSFIQDETSDIPSCPPTLAGGDGRSGTPRYGGEPTVGPAPSLTPRTTRLPTAAGGNVGTSPTVEPSVVSSSERGIFCGCDECTAEVLDQLVADAGGSYTCRDRIKFLVEVDLFTEREACSRVADEFPDSCGMGCDPLGQCSAPVVSDCGCPNSCTGTFLDRNATDDGGTSTCRERMNFLMAEYGNSETSACARVSREFPDVCAPECDPDLCGVEAPTVSPGREGYPLGNETAEPGGVVDCGCPGDCDAEVLDRMAGSYSCRERINWVILESGLGFDETEACIVLNNEYPDICTCNPRDCEASSGGTPRSDMPSDVPSDIPSIVPTLTSSPTLTNAPTLTPTVTAGPTATSAPSSLYAGRSGNRTGSKGNLAKEMKAVLENQGVHAEVGESGEGGESSSPAIISVLTGLLGLLSIGLFVL